MTTTSGAFMHDVNVSIKIIHKMRIYFWIFKMLMIILATKLVSSYIGPF